MPFNGHSSPCLPLSLSPCLLQLRHRNAQIFPEGELDAFSGSHRLGGGLGKSGDEDRHGDGGVAANGDRARALGQAPERLGLIEFRAGVSAVFRCFRDDLNRVLMASRRIVEHRRRRLALLNEGFGRAAAETHDAGRTRFGDDLRHLHDVLNHIELKAVFLFDAADADGDAEGAIGDRRAVNRHSRFER
jgi:hypothetical protein